MAWWNLVSYTANDTEVNTLIPPPQCLVGLLVKLASKYEAILLFQLLNIVTNIATDMLVIVAVREFKNYEFLLRKLFLMCCFYPPKTFGLITDFSPFRH